MPHRSRDTHTAQWTTEEFLGGNPAIQAAAIHSAQNLSSYQDAERLTQQYRQLALTWEKWSLSRAGISGEAAEGHKILGRGTLPTIKWQRLTPPPLIEGDWSAPTSWPSGAKVLHTLGRLAQRIADDLLQDPLLPTPSPRAKAAGQGLLIIVAQKTLAMQRALSAIGAAQPQKELSLLTGAARIALQVGAGRVTAAAKALALRARTLATQHALDYRTAKDELWTQRVADMLEGGAGKAHRWTTSFLREGPIPPQVDTQTAVEAAAAPWRKKWGVPLAIPDLSIPHQETAKCFKHAGFLPLRRALAAWVAAVQQRQAIHT